jgi:glycosyltransferase involved in cell wall biosynthesis
LQGLDTILRAVSIIKNKIDFHLYIWGSSEQKSSPFKKMIQELSIEEFVTIHNEWENIKEWEKFIIKICDVTLGIFGQSSKAKTVLANKVIDGVAFRTPVITAHSGGLYNYFTGKNDIFTTENNPTDLAHCIENIYHLQYSDIKERIDNAYEVYQNYFTPEQFDKKLIFYLSEQVKN